MPLVGTRSDQQQAVYTAEETVSRGKQFATLEDAQAFVDSLTAADWWSENYPDIQRIDVVKQRENSPCVGTVNGRVGKIGINTYGLCERIILHEVAHTVEPRAGHNGPWVRAFINLMNRVCGSERYLELWTAFSEAGIDLG